MLLDPSIEVEDQMKRAFDELPAEEYTISKKYEELKSLLLSERVRLEKVGRREALRIPPIAFDVLSRIQSLDSIGERLLELRDDYHRPRRIFTERDELLRSPDVPMKKKRAEEQKLKKDWDEFMKPKPVGWIEYCAAFVDRLKVVAKLADPKEWPNVLLYLAGLPSVRFYLRPLLATRKWYEKATLNDLHRIVSQHFGHDLKPEELRLAREYLAKRDSSG